MPDFIMIFLNFFQTVVGYDRLDYNKTVLAKNKNVDLKKKFIVS